MNWQNVEETQAAGNQFILGDLAKVLTHIEQSTMGSESEEDFGNLFEDLRLDQLQAGQIRERQKRTHCKSTLKP